MPDILSVIGVCLFSLRIVNAFATVSQPVKLSLSIIFNRMHQNVF